MTPHGLVLAGGTGSRLAAEGLSDPKPLVSVGGRPQVVRLIETMLATGCPSVTCMVREGLPGVRETIESQFGADRVKVVLCRTPSSLHTLVAGLGAVPHGAIFCAMVDTVMRPPDWQRAFRETTAYLEEGADAVLVVTPFVQDETPLYVHRDAQGLAVRVGSQRCEPPLVTGGVYGFNPTARSAAGEAVAAGVHRMRGFLQRLLEEGARVPTVEVEQVVDLDRVADLKAAEAMVA
jgi:GTP:adenosylcobinamide-phosphate guanylyltransferase